MRKLGSGSASDNNVKVGDRFRIISERGGHVGTEVWLVRDDDSSNPFFSTEGPEGAQNCCIFFEHLELIEGENAMADGQEFTYPEYVVVVKNTEVFVKGGVFKKDGGYYKLVGESSTGYQASPYSSVLTKEQVRVLIEKKVAVEAVKFNPEFVTLEQNEILKKALAESVKPAARKAVKKTAKKA